MVWSVEGVPVVERLQGLVVRTMPADHAFSLEVHVSGRGVSETLALCKRDHDMFFFAFRGSWVLHLCC